MKPIFHFFISYTHANSSDAKWLYDRLTIRTHRNRKIRVFLDQETIQPGDSIPQNVIEALSVTAVFVLLISKDSLASDYVNKEIQNWLHQHPTNSGLFKLIPVKLDQTPLPSGIHELAAIDAAAGVDESTISDLLSVLN